MSSESRSVGAATDSGPRVAVIDIGSNSIKVLVAARDASGALVTVATRTLDARISAGIGGERPELSAAGMERGVEAVRQLLEFAAPHAPARIQLVATSAVRDARNGAEFRARIHAATGHPVRILSGNEEASLIGRGLTCDPALAGLADFYVFDLGGGSLECLAFQGREMTQACSFPLGCVRLTERFVPQTAVPYPSESDRAAREHVRAALAAGFKCDLPPGAQAVATGGTVTTVRALLAARSGRTIEATSPAVPVAVLAELLDWLGALPLEERRRIPGLPPARADVFPVALSTFLALAEYGGFEAFHHSFYNLRYGIADRMIAGEWEG